MKNMVQCHICRSKGVKLVEVLNGLYEHDPSIKYNLYGCNNCSTLFFNPFPQENYAELISETFDRFEIEFNAGLQFMASLIYPLRELSIKSMLDIGCGLGYLMDIAKCTLEIERVLGIDPSYVKRMNIFDNEVLSGYFPEAMGDERESFDLITSSEVLEHTHDPYGFLQNIINSLSKNGIAVLSTPNADAYFSAESEAERITLASPGGHTILFSRQSLEMVLDKLDIVYRIFLWGGKSATQHMIIYLSRRGEMLKKINYSKPTSRNVIDFLRGYLEARLEEVRSQKNTLYFGYLFRLVGLRINDGEYSRSEKIMDEMITGLMDYYGIDVLNLKPENLYQKDEEITLDVLMKYFPSFLGKFLYFYGIYLMNYKQDLISARRIFETAHSVLKLEQSSLFFFANRWVLKNTEYSLKITNELIKNQDRNIVVRTFQYYISLLPSILNIETIKKIIATLRNDGIKVLLKKLTVKLRRNY